MKRKKLKEIIIDVAIRLFNNKGVNYNTTNHIISAVDISPGTFYYYFKNKEELIREIFQNRITSEFDDLFNIVFDKISVIALLEQLRGNFNLYKKYSFFFLEIAYLLSKDSKLRIEYQKNMKIKHQRLVKLFDVCFKASILKEINNPLERSVLLQNLWILNDFWLTYLFCKDNKITDESVGQGILHSIVLLKPYLSNKALEEVNLWYSNLFKTEYIF